MVGFLHNFSFILQIFLLIVLGIPSVYLFFFSIAGLFYKQPRKGRSPQLLRKVAILIPGYKEDAVIIEVARKALEQDYPRDLFEVIIIADSFFPETVSELKSMPVRVIEVVFNKSTKVRALRRAMQKVDNSFDLMVVLDADNVMENDFLKKINTAFDDGFLVVQGHRKAANTDTSMAVLDAISEEINNHIFRKGHRAVGLSSAIIGSGMVFQADYFKSLIIPATAVGGFDKELELNILKDGIRIEYLEDAVLYDEKVRKADAFRNQRRRWLSSQIHYLRQDFFNGLRLLFLRGKIDYFDKIFQFLLPPRAILLAGIIILSALFIPSDMFIGSEDLIPWWIILAGLCTGIFVLSVPRYFYNLTTLKALASLPKGIWMMMSSLMRVRGANTDFIHTVHGTAVKSKT